MEKEELMQKVGELVKDCACGSGKKAYLCCQQEAAKAVENEVCPMSEHNGSVLKDCCMKHAEATV